MIYHGIALMVCSGLGLAGVLAQLHHQVVTGYHDLVLDHPLTRPHNWIQRRHLRRSCRTCSLAAELAVAHATAR